MKKKVIKKRVKSTDERLRLSVFRSNRNISAQIIDDKAGKTLVSANSLKLNKGNDCEAASKLGLILAQHALKKKIKKVFLDRGSSRYTGRIKAFADAARQEGLEF